MILMLVKSIKEVAKEVGFSVQSIRYWILKGIVKPQKIGSTFIFTEEDIVEIKNHINRG
jgi:DNA-binding transcriptional MerR regulator